MGRDIAGGENLPQMRFELLRAARGSRCLVASPAPRATGRGMGGEDRGPDAAPPQ